MVASLARQLEGHRIQEIAQPDAQSVVLGTYGHMDPDDARRQFLLLTCHPQTARISQVERMPKALAKPPHFTQYLRAHVKGATLTGFDTAAGDRIVRLALSTSDGLRTLLISLMGRRTNVYLLDEGDRLLVTLRPLEATRPELELGRPWRPPGSHAPLHGDDRFSSVPDEELLAAVEARFGAVDAKSLASGLHKQIDHALRKHQRRLSRKLEKIEREMKAAQESIELARHGELLKTQLGRIERGQTEIEVADPETGENISIALDPARSPSENLDRIFKRYQKAVRRLTKGGAQEDAVRAAYAQAQSLKRDFDARDDAEASLRNFSERPDVAPILKRYAPRPPTPTGRVQKQDPGEVRLGKLSVPRRLAPRRYKTAGDLEIWVGRSDAANDHLTTQLARGKDLFFHLDGAPGSHVILRTEGKSDPPSDAVLDACELAVHFSKFKRTTRADVHVVPIKNVRKPRGAKPGLVMVHGGKNIHLRRDEARLTRILEAQVGYD